MANLLISAAHKSSGKTTVTLGLCRALARRGLAVQPFKKGPDYIDPMWLTAAAGRRCRNLDYYTMTTDEISACFATNGHGSDIAIVEGNKGLYDGLELDGSTSNAALAELLHAPVVLVIDARGMTRGIAPLILGYQAFDPNIHIAGIILNKIGGARHEEKLRAIIEHHTDVPVIGAVHRDETLEILERHLGLIPSNETADSEARIDSIADMIERQVDLDRVIAIARSAKAPKTDCDASLASPLVEGARRVRIGIARDTAFGFYYTGDLEALERAGATLVPFDTMKDHVLPDVDGLFIGGGFPETHIRELEANAPLRSAIRDAIEGGMPAYAECGGLMYLCRKISWRGLQAEMVGVLPADVVMHDRPKGRGYVQLRETGKNPWPSIGGGGGCGFTIPAHEFHYSTLENLAEEGRDGQVNMAYEVLRGTGIDGRHDGLVYKNLLASYSHLRDAASHHWAVRFVAFTRNKLETT
ncbi:MAG: cobyrinate a,c-diamide synthase [Rhodospirillales bacterium]|nr:cobyrinate a,c-diamide synthase [Rhodospirillales bacterium]